MLGFLFPRWNVGLGLKIIELDVGD